MPNSHGISGVLTSTVETEHIKFGFLHRRRGISENAEKLLVYNPTFHWYLGSLPLPMPSRYQIRHILSRIDNAPKYSTHHILRYDEETLPHPRPVVQFTKKYLGSDCIVQSTCKKYGTRVQFRIDTFGIGDDNFYLCRLCIVSILDIPKPVPQNLPEIKDNIAKWDIKNGVVQPESDEVDYSNNAPSTSKSKVVQIFIANGSISLTAPVNPTLPQRSYKFNPFRSTNGLSNNGRSSKIVLSCLDYSEKQMFVDRRRRRCHSLEFIRQNVKIYCQCEKPIKVKRVLRGKGRGNEGEDDESDVKGRNGSNRTAEQDDGIVGRSEGVVDNDAGVNHVNDDVKSKDVVKSNLRSNDGGMGSNGSTEASTSSKLSTEVSTVSKASTEGSKVLKVSTEFSTASESHLTVARAPEDQVGVTTGSEGHVEVVIISDEPTEVSAVSESFDGPSNASKYSAMEPTASEDHANLVPSTDEPMDVSTSLGEPMDCSTAFKESIKPCMNVDDRKPSTSSKNDKTSSFESSKNEKASSKLNRSIESTSCRPNLSKTLTVTEKTTLKEIIKQKSIDCKIRHAVGPLVKDSVPNDPASELLSKINNALQSMSHQVGSGSQAGTDSSGQAGTSSSIQAGTSSNGQANTNDNGSLNTIHVEQFYSSKRSTKRERSKFECNETMKDESNDSITVSTDNLHVEFVLNQAQKMLSKESIRSGNQEPTSKSEESEAGPSKISILNTASTSAIASDVVSRSDITSVTEADVIPRNDSTRKSSNNGYCYSIIAYPMEKVSYSTKTHSAELQRVLEGQQIVQNPMIVPKNQQVVQEDDRDTEQEDQFDRTPSPDHNIGHTDGGNTVSGEAKQMIVTSLSTTISKRQQNEHVVVHVIPNNINHPSSTLELTTPTSTTTTTTNNVTNITEENSADEPMEISSMIPETGTESNLSSNIDEDSNDRFMREQTERNNQLLTTLSTVFHAEEVLRPKYKSASGFSKAVLNGTIKGGTNGTTATSQKNCKNVKIKHGIATDNNELSNGTAFGLALGNVGTSITEDMTSLCDQLQKVVKIHWKCRKTATELQSRTYEDFCLFKDKVNIRPSKFDQFRPIRRPKKAKKRKIEQNLTNSKTQKVAPFVEFTYEPPNINATAKERYAAARKQFVGIMSNFNTLNLPATTHNVNLIKMKNFTSVWIERLLYFEPTLYRKTADEIVLMEAVNEKLNDLVYRLKLCPPDSEMFISSDEIAFFEAAARPRNLN
ncbi:unnamed protein product [Bursaphelenchus okinawaensis]|uniref:Uncharacterized protein n=1 Tax=Bursaphelenchus okinawaensis TaxID=465554 RepID=A0A811KH34_9BILA|nr:unnamed protein product [Bursaphelenchus okinawaensis]CAG9102205.1 unnamed protein product [Bursaphelenchus okinawaensis]